MQQELHGELGCWGKQRVGGGGGGQWVEDGGRAACCWYSGVAAVPDAAAIFTHSAAFFRLGRLNGRRVGPERLCDAGTDCISVHDVREKTPTTSGDQP